MGSEFGVGCLMRVRLEDGIGWGEWFGRGRGRLGEEVWSERAVWLGEGLVGGVSLVEERSLVGRQGSLVWFLE